MVLKTRSSGNLPPFRLVMVVRSGGGIFSAATAGPPPLASVPWQTAQYVVNISFPDDGDVREGWTFLIAVGVSAPRIAKATTSATSAMTTRVNIIPPVEKLCR